MSAQLVTLAQLNVEFGRQGQILVGREWSDPAVQHQAKSVAAAYCRRIDALFGVSLEPVVTYDETTGRIELSAKPSSDLDGALLDRLLAREAQPSSAQEATAA